MIELFITQVQLEHRLSRCSNYVFTIDLATSFNRLCKSNCKTRRETFKFWDLVPLISDIWRYVFLYEREIPFQKVVHSVSGWVLFLCGWFVENTRLKCISPMHEDLSIFTCTRIIEMHRINFMMEYARKFNEYIRTTYRCDATEYVTIMIHRQWRFGWIGHLKY